MDNWNCFSFFTQVPAAALPSEKFLAQISETKSKSDKPEGLVDTDLSFKLLLIFESKIRILYATFEFEGVGKQIKICKTETRQAGLGNPKKSKNPQNLLDFLN